MTSRLLSFSDHTAPAVEPTDSHWLLGPSPAVAQLWMQLRRVAPHFRTALLVGEPGCGAEFAARVLHQLSPAANRPFLVLTAADAEERFRGNSSYANEGVIFLPELDCLSPAAQAGLLRMVHRRGVRSPRVVATCNRSLRALVAADRFSPELASALGAIHITLPALRDRAQDIAPLAHFALRVSAAERQLPTPRLAPCLLDAAHAFSWPGNLDQLRAAFEWLMETHGSQPTLYARDLEAALAAIAQASSDSASPVTEPRLVRLDLIVQEHVTAVLSACQGNKLRAAEVLGISRSTLYRMLDQNIANASSGDTLAMAV